MKNNTQKYIALIFFSSIIIIALSVITSPKETFSDIENRYLRDFPEVNLTTIMNKEAMDGIENFIYDHFPARVFLVKTKTAFDIAIGKREINDVYISKERFIQKMTVVDEEITNGNINSINSFAARYDLPVYIMIVPTAAGIYGDTIPSDKPNLNQKNYIKEIYHKLDKSITPIEIFDNLSIKKEDYLYYRTDHHWTTNGAFIAYQKAADVMGFEATPEQDFYIECAADDFYGSLYSKVLYDNIKADSVYKYHRLSGENLTKMDVFYTLDTEPRGNL